MFYPISENTSDWTQKICVTLFDLTQTITNGFIEFFFHRIPRIFLSWKLIQTNSIRNVTIRKYHLNVTILKAIHEDERYVHICLVKYESYHLPNTYIIMRLM